MAESILPSTRRKGARDERKMIHRRERARVRAALRDVGNSIDVDGSDVGGIHRHEKGAIREMVLDRRSADKVGSLVRWAERTVAKTPTLRVADWDARMAYFRRMFPDNTIGRHALSHIEWAVGTPPSDQFRTLARRRATRGPNDDGLRAAVQSILSEGAHGDLNRRIKQDVPTVFARRVQTKAGVVVEEYEVPLRLLTGQHDLDAFVAAIRGRAEAAVVRAVATELSRRCEAGSSRAGRVSA